MDIVSLIIMALVSTLQCLRTFSANILEGKPSKQSSTIGYFRSYKANDGNFKTECITRRRPNSYWEGDLGGYYNVRTITVRSPSDGWAYHLRKAIIETATSSMGTCRESVNNFRCGQWPDVTLRHVSITFNCSYFAVRFVRIRKEVVAPLAIVEVAAEGIPSILPGQQYFNKIKSKKVTTPMKSLSVARVTDCCLMCHATQSCLAFSFSMSQQPNNCLLAVDPSWTNDGEWIGYVYNECVALPTLGQQYYEKLKSKKVTTPIKSLSVGKVTECGTMCSRTQPCLAFSFSKSQTPNCLLAIDTSMATDAEWIGYKLNECMTMPITCPPIG